MRDRPLLHQVIPVIDIIEKMLSETIHNTTLKPVVRRAASYGKAILNKYYAKTDDSIIFRIAMSEFFAVPRVKYLYLLL